jgi:NADP-dependent 3-hydroxy acid dehydrogenase YdfG
MEPPSTPGPKSVRLRVVELDVSDQASVDAMTQISAETARLDVVVHNAGHMVLGPDVWEDYVTRIR